MLDKIYIVDFEDSFTFNIANIIYPDVQEIKVVAHHHFFNTYFHQILTKTNRIGVVLGPGPGHPDEYSIYFEKIKILMNLSHVYLLGICLGHQMIGRVQGFRVEAAKELIHGNSVEFDFFGRKVRVQRYNSLAVYEAEEELNLLILPCGISYQFHPESIGTEENALFFRDLINFVMDRQEFHG